MLLITPTLLNSFGYYFHFEGEASEADDGTVITAEQKEASVTGYLENDPEAKALYYGRWKSLGGRAT